MGSLEEGKYKYIHLHRYATWFDWCLLCVGSLCSIATGARFPSFLLLFGSVLDDFTSYGINEQCGNNCSILLKNQSAWDGFLGSNATLSFYVRVGQTFRNIAVLGILIFLIGGMQAFCWSLYGTRQASTIRLKLFGAILRQEITFLQSASVGELNQYLNEDMHNIQVGISEQVSHAISNMSSAILSLALGLWLSWKLSLVAIATLPLFIAARVAMLRGNGEYRAKEHKAYSQAGSIAEEAIASIRTVTSLGCQQETIQRGAFELAIGPVRSVGLNRILVQAGRNDHNAVAGFFKPAYTLLQDRVVTGASIGWMRLAVGALYSVSFWYGAQLFLSNDLRAGEVSSTIFSMILMGRSFGEFVTGLQCFAKAGFAGNNVLGMIDHPSKLDVFSDTGSKPSVIKSNVEFNKVTFRYPKREDTKVFDQLSLTVPEGKTVAIAGASGAGKTTFAKLLQRWHDVEDGSISIGGHDIRDLNLRWLRSQISFVAQQPVLFNTTIEENIGWGGENVTKDQIVEAASLANAIDFIEGLPNGFQTLVGDRGIKLSGGQKQRIAIARALIGDPKILVLDEATSALDTENEALVQKALIKASVGRTTIVIAHRLNTITSADKICLLKGGSVAESGTHDELMRLDDGAYRSLVEHQLEKGDLSDACCAHGPLNHSSLSEKTENCENHSHNDDVEFASGKLDNNSSFLKVLSLSKPEWPFLTLGCFCGVISGCADAVMGLLFGHCIALFLNEDVRTTAIHLAAGYISVAVLNSLSYTGSGIAYAKCSANLIFRLRKALFWNLLRQEIGYFDQPCNSCSSLADRMAMDAIRTSNVSIDRIDFGIKLISALGCAVIISLAMSWQLALLALAITPFTVFSAVLNTRVFQPTVNVANGEFASEMISNMTTLVGLTGEERALAAYKESQDAILKARYKNALAVGASNGFSQCMLVLSFASLFGLGAYLIVSQGLSPGNVIKVGAVITFTAMVSGQVTTISPDFTAAKRSAARLFQLLERKSLIEPLCEDHLNISVFPSRDIIFRDVRFCYPSRPGHVVLDGVNFTIKGGQTMALVGKSGCGKSTCIQLLQRFYDVDGGLITLDGQDIRFLNTSWLRNQIGMVEQEPLLFDQSVRDNITLGLRNQTLTDVELKKLVEISNLELICEKVGTSTIGRGGAYLSVGQRQRVAVARALAREPAILLLDEATSSLDAESEKIIQEALKTARKGRTCLVVAHRLSTVRDADSIAVLEGGKIVEIGTHSDLVRSKGAYSRLIEAQYIKD